MRLCKLCVKLVKSLFCPLSAIANSPKIRRAKPASIGCSALILVWGVPQSRAHPSSLCTYGGRAREIPQLHPEIGAFRILDPTSGRSLWLARDDRSLQTGDGSKATRRKAQALDLHLEPRRRTSHPCPAPRPPVTYLRSGGDGTPGRPGGRRERDSHAVAQSRRPLHARARQRAAS